MGRQRLERLVGLPALDADHWETKLVQPVEQDRRHSPRLEYDATTTRRFGQFVGDRLRSRLCLALANHQAFAVENANMRLVHRDIEASKIVHRTVSSSESPPILSAYVEESPAHYPMLKNSEIEPPRKSRFRARRAISADGPHARACRRGARGKTGRSADPLRKFS